MSAGELYEIRKPNGEIYRIKLSTIDLLMFKPHREVSEFPHFSVWIYWRGTEQGYSVEFEDEGAARELFDELTQRVQAIEERIQNPLFASGGEFRPPKPLLVGEMSPEEKTALKVAMRSGPGRIVRSADEAVQEVVDQMADPDEVEKDVSSPIIPPDRVG